MELKKDPHSRANRDLQPDPSYRSWRKERGKEGKRTKKRKIRVEDTSLFAKKVHTTSISFCINWIVSPAYGYNILYRSWFVVSLGERKEEHFMGEF